MKKGKVSVDKVFMEMLVTRYSAALGVREVAKARRQYVSKHYNTRRLSKELRRIYNELLTADNPAEIKRLRSEYLELRKKIAQIREARSKDPTYQELSGKVRALNEGVKALDEMIIQKLKEYGYEVKPITEPEIVEAKIREFNPNSRAVASAGEAQP